MWQVFVLSKASLVSEFTTPGYKISVLLQSFEMR